MVERCSGELWQHYTCAFVRNEIIPSLKDTFLCAQLTTLESVCSVTSPVISPASILSLTLFTVFVSLCKVEALSAVHAAYKWESEIRPFVC